jgi:hypothetical protein
LKRLDLSETKINHEGLKQLKALPSLKNLLLEDTDVDNRGVSELRHLVNLEELRLEGTKIEGQGGIDAAWAQSLSQLAGLTLARTRVDDRCIPALANLPNLDTLYLQGTRVTPAGIDKLVQLRNQGLLQRLCFLGVSPNQVGEETQAALIKAFDEFRLHIYEEP